MKSVTVIIEPCEEGGFMAYIPEVPGAVSQGETVIEAKEMVLEALAELMEFRRIDALKGLDKKAIVESISA